MNWAIDWLAACAAGPLATVLAAPAKSGLWVDKYNNRYCWLSAGYPLGDRVKPSVRPVD